jgi:hypothetical protein
MAEPSGHTLLTRALAVMRQAIEAHRDTSPWREIVAATSGPKSPTFAVALCEGDPERIVDRYVIRAHEGRFEVLEHGTTDPEVDWRVTVDHLRDVVADPDRYVAAPERLGLGWLVERLGIGRPPQPAPTWRIGRVRRPR